MELATRACSSELFPKTNPFSRMVPQQIEVCWATLGNKWSVASHPAQLGDRVALVVEHLGLRCYDRICATRDLPIQEQSFLFHTRQIARTMTP
jgi:hypothetical protein